MKATNCIIVLFTLGISIPAGAISLSTTDGQTYDNITSQRADPDGILVEYSLPGGGIGMSKVKFNRLTEEQQKQFGYDASKAAAFSAACAKATEDAFQERMKWDAEAKADRTARDAQNLEQEKLMTERLLALAQLKMQSQNNEAGYNGSIAGGAYAWPLDAGLGGNGFEFSEFGRDFNKAGMGFGPFAPFSREKIARLNPVLRPVHPVNKP